MRRLLVMGTGLALAFLAAAVVLTGGLLMETLGLSARNSLMIADVASLILGALGPGGSRWTELALTGIWRALLTLCFAPVCAVAVVLEVVGRPTMLRCAAATGLLSAALPVLLQPSAAAALVESRFVVLLFLAGAISGGLYATIAGKA